MSTLGEANVGELFSTTLERAVIRRLGDEQCYMKGNLAGKADKLFADFFVGLPFANVLIEFKGIESGAKAEKRKPLRAKLCKSLNMATYWLSQQSHFLAWGEGHESTNLTIVLSEYVSKVCPSLGGASVELCSAKSVEMQPFLARMFERSLGLDIPDFIVYLEFLAKLPDDPTGPSPSDVGSTPFPAQWLSFNGNRVLSTPIHSIADLRKTATLLSGYQASTPPPPGGGTTWGTGGGMF